MRVKIWLGLIPLALVTSSRPANVTSDPSMGGNSAGGGETKMIEEMVCLFDVPTN